MQIASASILSQGMYAAASLGVADHLQDGPKTAEELARATGAHPGALHRLLRALASVDVFSESEEGYFSLTPMASYLRSDAPELLRDMVLMMGSKWRWRVWEEIVHSIKTGQPAFDAVHGLAPFEYFSQNTEAATVFHRAMVSYTSSIAPAVAAAYDFSACRNVVDIGGGHGYLIATLLKANPKLHGVLFDRPEVVKDAPRMLDHLGVAGRCQIVGGNFFASIPPGGNIYIMKQILHDWDDERALAILRNCHLAMQPNGKLLLVETLVPTGNGPSHAKLLDLEMLLALGGKERTEKEYRELYAGAGFRLTQIIPTLAGLHIIEGELI